MLRSNPDPPIPPGSERAIRPIMTLALWRLRRTRFLLLFTTLGVLSAILVACVVPLFSQLTTTASLHSTLTADSTSSTITISAQVQGLSTAVIREFEHRFAATLGSHLTSYLAGAPHVSFDLPAAATSLHKPAPEVIVNYFATDMQQARSHFTLTQGSFPAATDKAVGILLTPETAKAWQVSVGTPLTLSITYRDTAQALRSADQIRQHQFTLQLKAYIAGLITVPASERTYWQGNDFEPYNAGSDLNPIGGFTFVLSSTQILAAFDQASAQHHANAAFAPGYIFFPNKPPSLITNHVYWQYHLAAATIRSDQLADLTDQLARAQADFTKDYGASLNATPGFFSFYGAPPPPPFPYLLSIGISSPLFHPPVGSSSLEQLRDRVATARIPVAIVSLQIIALILFFVSMMLDLLVEHQADAIALLRSRGASGRQIFGALMVQALGLSVLALLFALPLALGVTYFFAQRMLAPTEQAALNFITTQPLQALRSIMPYALAVVLVTLLAMGFALRGALSMDVLTIRREAARSTHRPFWQRLHLDIVAALVAIIGYALSVYLTGLNSLLDVRTKELVAAPLTLIAPLFLVLGCMFLLLRFFPPLLRLAAHFAGQGRGATSMLALAQMSRSPRQSSRMLLLLSCATAFAIFSLIFSASQVQRTQDIAAYEAGADFSGAISTPHIHDTLLPLLAKPQGVPGLLSSSVGFAGQGTPRGTSLLTQVRAVDAGTFSTAAIWPAQASSQPLASLMRQLIDQRQAALAANVVPVFVDAVAWDQLHLHVGSTFTISVSNLSLSDLPCRVIGRVEHIPTVNDSTGGGLPNEEPPPGGVLADYQTYAAIYAHNSRLASLTADTLPQNYFWLHTKDDAASLANVRATLSQVGLDPTDYFDRRALIRTLDDDPLYVNLTGILTLGAITALLLAIVGDLLASLLSARSRLTNFAILRALGISPRQVAHVLTWEQVIIFAGALLLGALFGSVLATTIVPNLVFSSMPASGILSQLSTGEFYALQRVIPAQVVLPPSLGVTYITLVVICVISLGMMVRIVLQPSMSQILRLNED